MLYSASRRLMLLTVMTALAMLLLGGQLLTGSHISALNEQAAQQLVMRHVPATAVHLATEVNADQFHFQYYDIPTTLHYLIDIDRQNGLVAGVSARLADPSGSAKVLLDERTIRWILSRHFRSLIIESLSLQSTDGRKRYLANFTWTGLYGSAAVSPETGQLLEYALQTVRRLPVLADRQPAASAERSAPAESGSRSEAANRAEPVAAATAGSPAEADAHIQADGCLPAERIRTIALNHIVGGTIVDLDLEQNTGASAYVVKMAKAQLYFILIIDAATGIVLSIEQNEAPTAGRSSLSATGSAQVQTAALQPEPFSQKG